MLCVQAELISTRLLSKDDKQDMLNGDLPLDTLVAHVKTWKDQGLNNYVTGI